ncbi:MAG: hypothetical protein F6J93_31240 [Oscillatoria sp. SIO1A7]|nr:hypothetical protein [Oscillatoria sp. SIO1A7]
MRESMGWAIAGPSLHHTSTDSQRSGAIAQLLPTSSNLYLSLYRLYSTTDSGNGQL